MIDTKMRNGYPLYFYMNESKKQAQITAMGFDNVKLSRKKRRQIERKLNKLRLNTYTKKD